jgi:hypothetical protein
VIRKLKAGVSLAGLAPEMLIADAVVAAVFEELGALELVITSVGDGQHGARSLHTIDPVRIKAIDYRRWTLQITVEGEDTPAGRTLTIDDRAPEAARRIAHRLRDQFDVILEATHLHVEFDPPPAAPRP